MIYSTRRLSTEKDDNPAHFFNSDTTIIKLNNNYTEQFLSDKLY